MEEGMNRQFWVKMMKKSTIITLMAHLDPNNNDGHGLADHRQRPQKFGDFLRKDRMENRRPPAQFAKKQLKQQIAGRPEIGTIRVYIQSNFSTTGMIRHLKSCHHEQHIELQKARWLKALKNGR
jgi:hypothetical protein